MATMAITEGVEVRLRGVPKELAARIKAWAALEHRDMNTFIINVLERAVDTWGPPEDWKPRSPLSDTTSQDSQE